MQKKVMRFKSRNSDERNSTQHSSRRVVRHNFHQSRSTQQGSHEDYQKNDSYHKPLFAQNRPKAIQSPEQQEQALRDSQKKGKDFFAQRYEQLGGDCAPVRLREAIRINPYLINEQVMVARLKALGVEVEKIPFAQHGYWVRARFSLGAIQEHFLGLYYVQEAAAQLPVSVLAPSSTDTVLDACASPGGKTSQLSEVMSGKGLIVSLERKEHRMPALLHNLERMRVPNVVVYEYDAGEAGRLGMEFDKILLDAPCSGNYASDAEWFDKRDFAGVMTSVSIQRRLLGETVKLLKPGGVLVYSTCSLEPEENELNVQWILERGGVVLEDTGLQAGIPGLTNVFGRTLHSSISLCRRFGLHKLALKVFLLQN